jgi:hypothetical protein
MRTLRTLGSLVLVALWGGAADAQVGPVGVVVGVVSDKGTGEPVGNATVVLLSTQRDNHFTPTMTAGTGRFRFYDVPAGTYDVLVIFGQTQTTRGGVVVKPFETTPVGVRLDTAGAGESITIREKIPHVEPVAAKPVAGSVPARLPYSDKAILENSWGLAWLLLYVDEAGVVQAVKFLKRPGHDLDDITLEGVFKLRFEPARDDTGRAVKSVVLWRFEWPSFAWAKHYGHVKARIGHRRKGAFLKRAINVDSLSPTYRDCGKPDLTGAERIPLIPRRAVAQP